MSTTAELTLKIARELKQRFPNIDYNMMKVVLIEGIALYSKYIREERHKEIQQRGFQR